MTNFDKQYDINALSESLKTIEENGGGDFPEVPIGKYAVKVDSIELGETKETHKPMAKAQFTILDGQYKKSKLFYNQVLIGEDKETKQPTAFGVHMFNNFLKTLDSKLNIEFVNFAQYNDLLLDVAESVQGLEYDIQYSKKNDFPIYQVLEVYEA